MGSSNESSDFLEITSRAMDDIQNLKSQIERLLLKMEVVDNIKNVPVLPLPSEDVISRNASLPYEKPSVRMEWKDVKKERRKGKAAVPAEASKMRDLDERMLKKEVNSSLEMMETSVKESSMKYVLKEDSVFFVPLLDRWVFGMTVVNASEKKIPPPVVRLSLLPGVKGSSTDETRRTCRNFLYDVRVFLKEGESSNCKDTSPGSSHHVQDTFSQYLTQDQDFSVAQGSEVLVTANFSYPFQFSLKDQFQLFITISLGGKELWTKQLVITSAIFNAAVIDFVFKKHHMDINRALEIESQGFGLERIGITEEEKIPKKSFEHFLFPYGFESIASHRSGIDKTVEFYATNQPSMLWGTCFMVETCSRRQTFARCILTTRTKGQLHTLMQLFKTWLQKEINKDKRYGFDGLKLHSLNPKTNTYVKTRFEQEIELIQRLMDIKLVHRNGNKTSSGSRNAALSFSNKSEPNGVDTSWIYEYASCVTKTDAVFVDKMKY